jgi:hypothetical protein
MAYYVAMDVFADSISYPSYTVPSSGTWIVSGNCSVDNSVLASSGQFAVFALNGSAIVSLWLNGDNGDVQPVFNTPSGASFSGSGAGLFPTDGTTFDWQYELNLATGFCEIFIDSVSVYSKTVSTGIAGDVAGYVASSPTTRLNFNNEALCRLYSIDFGGTRAYDPNDYIGTGTNLPDNIGTADATTASAGMFVFYSAGALTIITSPIASGEVVGSPTFTTGVVLINPVAIATSESVGSPTISSGGIIISPTVIASQELVGSPTVLPLGVVLQPTVIVTEEVVGSPVLVTGIVIILPTGIPSEGVVGEPFVDLLLKQIFPTEILSLEDVGRPIILGGDSIIIPIPNRQTWNAVARYLRALVFTGYDNDVIMKWLRSEGYEDAYNDNWDDYLLGQGYLEGALADRYAQWRQGVAGDDPWILSEGSWNDIKIWRDNENWRDS